MVKTLSLNDALQSVSLPGLDRNLFSSPQWLAVIQKAYKTNFFVKYIETNQTVKSYIVYSVVKNFLEWKICICSYCDYFDCWVDDPADWQAFFEDLRQEYPRYRIAIRNLRDSTVRQNPNFHVLSQEKMHILDVRDPLEIVWKRTHDSFRSAVKQGEKSGLTIRRCEKGELQKFYSLHLKLRKSKYRLFAQPYRLFESIWDQYMEREQGVLLGAFTAQGELIAGNIYLICGNTLYYKFNTSRLDCLKRRPNNLLFWEGVKFAKERNLEFIDLGSSGCHQTGLILYKNHTGAQMLDINHLGFHPPGYKFSQKIILKTFTRLMTFPWMPNALTKLGSNVIYHYLA